MFKKLIQLFDQLEDHRVTGRIKYPLRLILLIVVVGLMRKGAAWKDYHMHAEAEKEKLKVFFPGLEVLPHVDTIARTTKRLIPGDLNEWFKHFIISNQEFLFGGNAVSGDTDFEKYRAQLCNEMVMIAIDGKEIIGATGGSPKDHLIIVNSVANGKIIGQEKVADKQKRNEIKVTPTLVEKAVSLFKNDARPIVFTTDAMSCTREIVSTISRTSSDYMLSLKGNNKIIHNEVRTLFDEGLTDYPGEIEYDVYESGPLFGHGRIDSYKCTVADVTSGIANKYLTQFSEWEGLKTVVRITRTSTVKKTGETTMTDRYYITNIDPDPKKILAIRLNHWKVETTHFFLDHTFEEDKCRVTKKGGAEVLSILRKLLLNILKIAQIEVRESFSFMVKKIQADSNYLAEIDSIIGNIFGDA